MDKIRVMCVDDEREIERTLCRMIDREPDMRCVELLEAHEDLVEAIRARQAAVLVLDLNMPGRDGLDLVSEVAKAEEGCRVIAYSGMDDEHTCDAVFNAGGWGLVSKHEEPRAVVRAIRTVMGGSTVFPE